MFNYVEVADYLGISTEDVNQRRFTSLVIRAEALIRAYATELPEIYEDWPQAAQEVMFGVVARAVEQQDMAGVESTQVTAGPFNMTRNFSGSSGAVWLSKQDKTILGGRPKGGAYSIDLMPQRDPDEPDLWRPM